MTAPTEYASLVEEAVAELRRNVAAAEGAAGTLVARLLAVGAGGCIAAYGVGREGLALKGFAMRLHHMGLQVRRGLAGCRKRYLASCCSAGRLCCADAFQAQLSQPAAWLVHAAILLLHRMAQASVVGEMMAARVGPGDLLLVSAGPGCFSTVPALCRAAEGAGAATLALTSQPATAAVQRALGAGTVLHLPATCMAGAGELACAAAALAATPAAGQPPSALLLGSSYELALQLFFDIVCVQLARRLRLSPEQLAARHTNLE